MKDKEEELIKNFGDEWLIFDQKKIPIFHNQIIFKKYFQVLPKNILREDSVVLDAGCGSGRWAYFIAPKVKKLFCLEPSKAIYVAKENLKSFENITFINDKIENLKIENNSIDFCYCLGVLHHTHDINKNLKKLIDKLKSGSPILLYLYYNFENRNMPYRNFAAANVAIFFF